MLKPPMLDVHSRLRADHIPELVAAIEGRTAKPALGKGSAACTRVRFSITLKEPPDGAIGVSALLDGHPLAPEVSIHPGAAFHFSYQDFLKHVPSARMGGAAEVAAALSRELQKLGDAIGKVVFAGKIGEELHRAYSPYHLKRHGSPMAKSLRYSKACSTARRLASPVSAAKIRRRYRITWIESSRSLSSPIINFCPSESSR